MAFTPEQIAEIKKLIRAETPVFLRRPKVSDLPPADNQALVWDSSKAHLSFEDQAPSGSGSGTVTTVKDSGSQVGGADQVTLDFGTGLQVTESPDKESNISIKESDIVHDNLSGGTADNAHHPKDHVILSHTDTNATGSQLNVLTDGSNADPLHGHSGGGVTDHGELDGLLDETDHPQYILTSRLSLLTDHGFNSGLLDDDHPQYAREAFPETITGEWTWNEKMRFQAGAAPSAPPVNFLDVRVIVSGTDLILRGYGPTGATCDICTISNTVVTGKVNTLMRNWIGPASVT